MMDSRPSYLQGIIGNSRPMRDVYEKIQMAIKSVTPVLIVGETGTGKELVARAIHLGSNRGNNFVARNCAAIPDTLVESELFGYGIGAFTGAGRKRMGAFKYADGGTLLLDEIGEMEYQQQKKLLRVLDDGEIVGVGLDQGTTVHARIISSTNQDLEQLIAQGKFRSDLYYRLSRGIRIRVPTLSERKEDIPELVDYFLKREASKSKLALTGVSQFILNRLVEYPWPGNVRQLEGEVENAVLYRATIGKENQSELLGYGEFINFLKNVPRADGNGTKPRETARSEHFLDYGSKLKDYMRLAEQEYIIHHLKDFHGNIADTARKIGVDVKTLYRKMNYHGLNKKAFKFFEK